MSNTDTNLTGPVAAKGEYSEEQYKHLRRKVDRYLLPLMRLCYRIQQTDKTALRTQAVFGLRKDPGLHGQQYILHAFHMSPQSSTCLISYRSHLHGSRVS